MVLGWLLPVALILSELWLHVWLLLIFIIRILHMPLVSACRHRIWIWYIRESSNNYKAIAMRCWAGKLFSNVLKEKKTEQAWEPTFPLTVDQEMSFMTKDLFLSLSVFNKEHLLLQLNQGLLWIQEKEGKCKNILFVTSLWKWEGRKCCAIDRNRQTE